MALADRIESEINSFIVSTWEVRQSEKIPDTSALGLMTTTGIQIPATFLYSDLAESSSLGQNLTTVDAAKIIKSFLYACSSLIKAHGGEIKSFDGDRVMGIFVGHQKEMRAVRAAFDINWVVQEVISDKASRWIAWSGGPRQVKHATGIASGEALLIRGGVRNDNDIASIGSAPNLAAKLSEIRGRPERTFADSDTWMLAYGDTWKDALGNSLWEEPSYVEVGGKYFAYYGSAHKRKPTGA
ncbi:MAG: adenylate/guanylate cyclase domain-containing protein [Homoserinimonas sp.]